jgi:SAM-dependent methyltransferase
MTPDNSYLVDYVSGSVPAACDPYPEGSAWAEPDLDQAAEYMQRVYRSPDEAMRKAQRAREDIRTKHNVDVTAGAVRRRLEEIRRTCKSAGVLGTWSGDRIGPAGSSQPLAREAHGMANLDRILPLLTPTPAVAAERRFRRPLLAAQRLLFRILRPYWWQQRTIQTSLVDSLRDVMQAVQSERHQWEAVAALWARLHAIEKRLRAADALPGSERRSALEADASSVVSSSESSAALRVKTFTVQLSDAAVQAGAMSSCLNAAPYMDERSHLYTDEQGRRILGFRSRVAAEANVYAGLEEILRGNEALVRERFRAYLPLLQTRERVIDIGCGRGEMLDLLSEAGIPALGVDLDAELVRCCRAKGHVVEQVDGVTYLRAQADASLPVIFSSRLARSLPYEDLLSLLRLSHAKLKAGGRLVLETVDPRALEALATVWTDVVHQRPIVAEAAVALCWLAGFEQAYVLFPNSVGDFAADRATRSEYAVVATKG